MSASLSRALKERRPVAEPASSSPPDSGVEPLLPPSPPLSTGQVSTSGKGPSESVSKLLQLLRLLKDGTSTERPPWDKHRLLREEYTELWERLDQDENESLRAWVENKLRYDYDHDDEYFVIRMPTRLHESFIPKVVARLRAQLATLSSTNPEIRGTVALIGEGNQWTIPLGSMADSQPEREVEEDSNPTKRSPDHCYQYKGGRWPTLVLEVSYSQKREDLDDVAYSFVRGSHGNINTVVGLDVEYKPPEKPRKTKKATLNVWRYARVRNSEGRDVADCVREVQDEPFRSDNGDALQGILSLTLADFLPPRIHSKVLTEVTRALPISISFSDLTSDLAEAEEYEASLRTRSGLSISPPPEWNVRKRAAPEELDSSREHKYQAVEEAEERKASQEDSDFEPPAHIAQEPEPVEANRRI
ncbi:hypothetical protein B0A49_12710, partial [Cryomyces minteri]